MDRKLFNKFGWVSAASAGRQPAATRRRRDSALGVENLEGRVVLSSGGASLPGLGANFGAQVGGLDRDGGHGGFAGFGQGRGGPRGFGGPGGLRGPGGNLGLGGASSVLRQDATEVNQAFQAFGASIRSAVSTLRQTATTTTPPTADGLAAFNAAVESAVSTLNTAITANLAGLPATGSTVAASIAGYTATLQDEVESAATGLANSTNTSVLALNREINGSIRDAAQQSAQAILSDAPSGTLDGATTRNLTNSTRTAFQTFQTSISSAKQAALTAGTSLDNSAVATAVATLRSSVETALGGLGTSFTASSSNPTATVEATLDSLTTQLAAIPAPAASSTTSARTFAMAVNAAVMKAQLTINQALVTAVNEYNTSLL